MKVLVIEASTTRMLHHFDRGSFAVVSAHRADKTSKENKKAHGELKRHLRTMKRGYTRMKGKGQEIRGGKTVSAPEKSVMVHNISHGDAHKIAKKFSQDYFVHKGTKGKAKLVHTKSKEIHAKWGKARVKGSEFSSRVASGTGKKRQVTFESLRRVLVYR